MFLLSLVSTCERFPELVLEVTTGSIESLPGREYKLIGSIESFGREPVTQHGFCWAETANPTKEESATQLGNKNAKGDFISIITKLPANTLFYVRAYAITEAGTEYGEEKTFATPAPSLPTITTTEISNITQGSAISGGTIIDDGGSEITAQGVCWDTISYPTIKDLHTSNGTDTGTFTSEISGINCSTTYYVRAYATNAAGTSYGNEVSFTAIECTSGIPIQTGLWSTPSEDVQLYISQQSSLDTLRITLSFSGNCSGSIVYTTYRVSITDRSFSEDLGSSWNESTGSIQGTFSSDGKSCSGTYDYNDPPCNPISESWTATPD